LADEPDESRFVGMRPQDIALYANVVAESLAFEVELHGTAFSPNPFSPKGGDPGRRSGGEDAGAMGVIGRRMTRSLSRKGSSSFRVTVDHDGDDVPHADLLSIHR